MAIYQSKGTLTGTIEYGNIGAAQDYLTSDDMTQYLEGSLAGAVELIEWRLEHDGRRYVVQAVTNRELTEEELKELASWTSGQNSDGLGEGFEQQPFAEQGDCGECEGCDDGECDSYGMVSFDWRTNDSAFARVDRA